MPDVLRDGPSNPKPRQAPVDAGMMNQLMRVAAIGTNVAFAVVAGALIGIGIDWLAGTKPWGLLIGAGFGVVGGLVTFIRESRKLMPPTPTTPTPPTTQYTEPESDGNVPPS